MYSTRFLDFSNCFMCFQTVLETLNPHNYLIETSDSSHTKSNIKLLGVSPGSLEESSVAGMRAEL